MIDNMDDFIDETHNTLKNWLDIHYDPCRWAEEWTANAIRFTFEESKGILSNNYFTFDWEQAALRRYAMTFSMYKCEECGYMFESGMYCDDHPDADTQAATEDEILEWLDDIGTESIPDNILLDALENEGFDAYSNAIHGYTDPVKDEIEGCLKALDNAETNQDRLSAILWAFRIYHVNGNIMKDYGDFDMADDIRTNGIESQIDHATLSEWLNE